VCDGDRTAMARPRERGGEPLRRPSRLTASAPARYSARP
jgi:hypothetical protein